MLKEEEKKWRKQAKVLLLIIKEMWIIEMLPAKKLSSVWKRKENNQMLYIVQKHKHWVYENLWRRIFYLYSSITYRNLGNRRVMKKKRRWDRRKWMGPKSFDNDLISKKKFIVWKKLRMYNISRKLKIQWKILQKNI